MKQIQQAEQWLSFRIGGQLYAAPLTQVSEVLRDGELTPVPGAADDLLGIRHLRGRIVPVLDGRRRLGLPEDGRVDPFQVRQVMLAHGPHLVGVRVDAIGDLLDARPSDIAPPPPGGQVRDDEPVNGVLPTPSGFVALLDVRRLCRLPLEHEAA